VLDGDPTPSSSQKGAEPPQFFGLCLLWPNDWMDQDGTWHGGRAWSSPHCARWRPSSPLQKGGRAPLFSAHLYCVQTAGCIKMPTWYGGRPQPRRLCVRSGPTPYPKSGLGPRFSDVYCGQTAAWIKMPLGVEVGLSPGDFVLYGDPPLPKNGAEPPIFGPCLLWPNGCMDQDATWYGGKPRPRRRCVKWGRSSP